MDSAPDHSNRRRLGAISYVLGNAALFANGLIASVQGDNHEIRRAGMGRMASAVLSSGTGAILARYGDVPVDKQLEKLEAKFANFLKKEGVPLETALLEKATKEERQHWFGKMEDFVRAHPMECANAYNTLAASGMLVSGILRCKRGETQSGIANIANFMMILAGTLSSIFIPEKSKDQIAARNQSGSVWGKMQEKPLAYAAVPFVAADLSYIAQARGEYRTAQQKVPGSAARNWMMAMSGLSVFTLVAATAADVLFGSHSKKMAGEEKDIDAAQERIMHQAATILASQPEDTRSALITKATDFLAKQENIRMTLLDKQTIAQRIQSEVHQIKISTSVQGAGHGM